MAKHQFIGLEVPESCAETLAGLDPGIEGARWTPAEQMHLALSLEWLLDPTEEERLRESLARVRVPPFFLPLQGIGSFGKPPAVALSVGIGKGHPHFFALHRHIQDAALHAQLKADLRPYHPHVTIARVEEKPEGKLLRFLRENAESEFCLWKVTGFALFSRDAAFGGTALTIEERWNF